MRHAHTRVHKRMLERWLVRFGEWAGVVCVGGSMRQQQVVGVKTEFALNRSSSLGYFLCYLHNNNHRGRENNGKHSVRTQTDNAHRIAARAVCVRIPVFVGVCL